MIGGIQMMYGDNEKNDGVRLVVLMEGDNDRRTSHIEYQKGNL